jgi:general secretion pathway protein F
VSASIDADSLRSARTKLRAEGIFPTEILEGKVRSEASELLQAADPQLRRIPDLDSRCSRASSPRWSRGLPLVQALAALTEQVERERFKTVIGGARVGERGHLARGSARLFPHVFDELYCSMVRAGESSGAGAGAAAAGSTSRTGWGSATS